MARRSIPIEEKIAKQQEAVAKAKARYETETGKLNELLKKKDEGKRRELVDAIMNSGRSYDEIMNFIQSAGKQ